MQEPRNINLIEYISRYDRVRSLGISNDKSQRAVKLHRRIYNTTAMRSRAELRTESKQKDANQRTELCMWNETRVSQLAGEASTGAERVSRYAIKLCKIL